MFDLLKEDLRTLGLPFPEKLNLDARVAKLTDQPMTNTVNLVAAASVLFYLAERNHNPRVAQVWDALVYCSTCISVGYSNIFPVTPVGKIIGSTLMTIGPSMAARTTDGPALERRDAVQLETLATLKQIVAQFPQDRQAAQD
jgi:hypothetical protein